MLYVPRSTRYTTARIRSSSRLTPRGAAAGDEGSRAGGAAAPSECGRRQIFDDGVHRGVPRRHHAAVQPDHLGVHVVASRGRTPPRSARRCVRSARRRSPIRDRSRVAPRTDLPSWRRSRRAPIPKSVRRNSALHQSPSISIAPDTRMPVPSARGEGRGLTVPDARGVARSAAERRSRRADAAGGGVDHGGMTMSDGFTAALDALERSGHLSERYGEPFVTFLPVTGASISTLGGVLGNETISATDARAARLDEAQFDLGEGPCWDAMRSAEPIAEPSLRTDGRGAVAGIRRGRAARAGELDLRLPADRRPAQARRGRPLLAGSRRPSTPATPSVPSALAEVVGRHVLRVALATASRRRRRRPQPADRGGPSTRPRASCSRSSASRRTTRSS